MNSQETKHVDQEEQSETVSGHKLGRHIVAQSS